MPDTPSPTPKPKRKRTNGRAMKARGDTYERELAAHIENQTGIPCQRTPLSGGGIMAARAGLAPSADLMGLPHLHVEAKRVEILNFRKALTQAETAVAKTLAQHGSETPPLEIPVVITRRNRETPGQSLVLLRLDAFLPLYVSWLRERGHAV